MAALLQAEQGFWLLKAEEPSWVDRKLLCHDVRASTRGRSAGESSAQTGDRRAAQPLPLTNRRARHSQAKPHIQVTRRQPESCQASQRDAAGQHSDLGRHCALEPARGDSDHAQQYIEREVLLAVLGKLSRRGLR
jgi:hypothetical protein